MQFKNTTGILLGIAAIIIGGGFVLNAIFSTYEAIKYPEYTMAATTSQVTVAAQIVGTISCDTSTTTTNFSSWTGGDTSIKTAGNASTSISCSNSSSGCTLYVKDAGGGGQPGLYKSPDLIESPNAAFAASTTLAAGTEGYGIKAATNTVGAGAALGIVSRYRTTGANDIGGLLITNTTIASSTATTSAREIIVTHMAAISAVTPSGSYSDTITYECTAN